jgi:hypothetical protein
MGSRLVGSAALCAAAVLLLGLFLGQCSCQSAPQTIVLGGASGWTDTANVNYTLFMSTVQFIAGDTLRKSQFRNLQPPFSPHCTTVLTLTQRPHSQCSHLLRSSSDHVDLYVSAGFNNTDTVDHDVYQVYSQADYDTCNNDNTTGWTINVGDFYDMVEMTIPTIKINFLMLILCFVLFCLSFVTC